MSFCAWPSGKVGTVTTSGGSLGLTQKSCVSRVSSAAQRVERAGRFWPRSCMTIGGGRDAVPKSEDP